MLDYFSTSLKTECSLWVRGLSNLSLLPAQATVLNLVRATRRLEQLEAARQFRGLKWGERNSTRRSVQTPSGRVPLTKANAPWIFPMCCHIADAARVLWFPAGESFGKSLA